MTIGADEFIASPFLKSMFKTGGTVIPSGKTAKGKESSERSTTWFPKD